MTRGSRAATFGALAGALLIGWLLWSAWSMTGGDGGTAPKDAGTADEDESALLGRVLDPSGRPVANASVTATPAAGGAAVHVTSDEGGAFRFGALAAGAWRVDASARGLTNPGPEDRRAMRVTIDDTTAVEVDLQLHRAAKLRGRVLRGDQPVAHAKLSLEVGFCPSLAGGLRDFVIDAGRADEHGVFELEAPPGRLRVAAAATGDAQGASEELVLADGAERDGVVIQLGADRRTAVLVGHVRGPRQQPLVAMIEVYSGEGPPRTTTSGADGAYRLADLPSGKVRMRVAARAYGMRELETTLVAGETTRLDVALTGAGGLRGRVVDAKDQPVSGATLLLRKGTESTQLVSEADGSFRIERPELLGDDATIRALSLQHADSEPQVAAPESEVVLRLGPGGEIHGVVLDTDGKPLPGAVVSVLGWAPIEPDPFSPQFVQPDRVVNEAAAFRLGPLRPGRYRLRGEAPGRGARVVEDVSVQSGGTTDDVVIRLGVGGTVQGHVRDDRGEPIAEARVMVWEPGSVLPPKMGRSDNEGSYQIAGVSPGRMSVRVQHESYLTAMESGIEVRDEEMTTRDLVLRRRVEGERFSFQGIGATLREQGGAIIVGGLMDDAPARAAGVQPGDRIVAVDGTTTLGMALSSVVERIRGEPGSTVLLDIERPGRGRVVIAVPRGQVIVK